MALRGIVISRGEIISAKDNSPNSLLKEDVTAVFIDDVRGKIFLWSGRKAKVTDKFRAARLAHMLNWKLFGGAGKVIQNEEDVKVELQKYHRVDDDIPRTEIASILG